VGDAIVGGFAAII